MKKISKIKSIPLIIITTVGLTSIGNANAEEVEIIDPRQVHFIKQVEEIKKNEIANNITPEIIERIKIMEAIKDAQIESEFIKKENRKERRLKRKTKRILSKVNREDILNNAKIRYLNKLNKIQSCVLMSDSSEELEICNKRVYNLSNKLHKIERRNKNISKNKYKNR